MKIFYRILLVLPTVLLISVAVFFLSNVVPYDSIAASLELSGVNEDHSSYKMLYEQEKQKQGKHLPKFYLSITSKKVKGINVPSIQWNGHTNQYHLYLKQILKGDFGTSHKGGTVFTKISEAIFWTFWLIVFSLIALFSISLPITTFFVTKRNQKLDGIIRNILLALHSIPLFWLATLILLLFTTNEFGIKLFHNKLISDHENTSLVYKLSKITPAVICIVLADLAYFVLLLRANMLANIAQPYFLTALSKGLTDSQTVRKHILPNSLIPIVVLLTNTLPLALAGSLVVELVFNIPGMGRLLYNSIYAADWQVVYGVVLIIGFITVLSYLIGDLLLMYVDPKLKTSNK